MLFRFVSSSSSHALRQQSQRTASAAFASIGPSGWSSALISSTTSSAMIRCQSRTIVTTSSSSIIFQSLRSSLPSCYRSIHSSSIRRSSMSTPLPTAASFDAPLPTLAPVDVIDITELTIDPSCIKRLNALSLKHSNLPVHLRVLVDQGGCSGLEYKFKTEIDTQPQDDDVVIPFGSTCVYVDRDSWVWLRGSRIEYHEELSRAAFIVSDNPNATMACGCKSSFAPKLDPNTNQPIATMNNK